MRYYHVDAFADRAFKGNPAVVIILHKQIDDSLMQNIAAEMNQPITVFALICDGKNPSLRYFRAQSESELCGHGTLAFSHIYFSEINVSAKMVIVDTKTAGSLEVNREDLSLTLSLSVLPGREISLDTIPDYVFKNLSPIKPVFALQSKDLVLVYDDEKIVSRMKPNFPALLAYKDHIIVTAASSKYDFVSRALFCREDKYEDSVTATAHRTLAPYWSSVLQKTKLLAFQASARGGLIELDFHGDRLQVTGKAITIAQGILKI